MTYPTRKIISATLLGLCLCVAALFTLDQSLALYFNQPELQSLWLAARNITNAGLSEHYFIISILTYVFCKWIRPQYVRARIWGRNFFFALIGSGILVHIVKFTFGRQRPHMSPDFNPWVFHPLNIDWNYHSFASGHSQVMFTVATFLSLGLPKWKWVFISVATIFAFTRVIIHDHFLSDIIGGAVIGYVGTITSLYWVQRFTKRRLEPCRPDRKTS